jgi:hypothetical protein
MSMPSLGMQQNIDKSNLFLLGTVSIIPAVAFRSAACFLLVPNYTTDMDQTRTSTTLYLIQTFLILTLICEIWDFHNTTVENSDLLCEIGIFATLLFKIPIYFARFEIFTTLL